MTQSIEIAFLAANPLPTTRLSLDEEARDIQAKLRTAEYRDTLVLKTRWAVRFDDLLQILNEDRPVIVHFSGHGSEYTGIVLHDEAGGAAPVSASVLHRLFTALKDNIRVVVLNSCYSHEQARAIAEVIDVVIGMKSSIGDDAARKFSASFYRAIGFGRSIQNAFDQGVLAIEGHGLGDRHVPELLVRAGVDPRSVFIAHPR